MRFKYALSTLLIGAGLIAACLAVYQFMFPAAPHKLPILGGRSTIHSYALGRDYVVEVNDEAIERSPRWNQFKRNPPLAARDAMVAADKLRMQMIKDQRLPATFESDENWIVDAIELHPAGDDRWYWLVRFIYAIDQTGPPNELFLPVLMDGTVLEPKEVTSSGQAW